jgi:glycosyltransferase involved in cell wall biosynthesis
MKLIIQVPCFNEEKTLPRTIADLPTAIDGINEIEYLIIDDGSTDKTVSVAREIGVHHVVHFAKNRGLARGFMAGMDACLRLGADIIVNTDADNQYNGEDVALLVRPVLEGKSDIVIGTRPIDEIEHFSKKKKLLQHLGSFVVRTVSGADVADAPSGFRAYSREAALRLNVVNEYTYTLESIIQAGHNRFAIESVPVRTNPETRDSRLFKSIGSYIRRSVIVIVRAYMLYKPLKFFTILASVSTLAGLAIGIRFLLLFFLAGNGGGHMQSLLLAVLLILIGVQCGIAGLQADLVASNRKILEDIQYHVRRSDYAQNTKEESHKCR